MPTPFGQPEPPPLPGEELGYGELPPEAFASKTKGTTQASIGRRSLASILRASEPKPSAQSVWGAISFAIGCAALGCLLSSRFFTVVNTSRIEHWGRREQALAVDANRFDLLCTLVFPCAGCGLATGVVGLCDATRRRRFAAAGSGLNSGALLVTMAFFASSDPGHFLVPERPFPQDSAQTIDPAWKEFVKQATGQPYDHLRSDYAQRLNSQSHPETPNPAAASPTPARRAKVTHPPLTTPRRSAAD